MTPTQRRRPDLRLVAGLVAGGLLAAAALWLLWHPLLPSETAGASLNTTIKNFFLGDQFTYLDIARNVADGGSAFVEPLTETGESIYPSSYFWLLGIVSRGLGVTVIGAWNLIGFTVSVLLLITTGFLGKTLTESPWGWSLAGLPIAVGTLHGWEGMWFSGYGLHAVLWPALAIVFNPGAEPATLLLTTAVLAGLVRQLRRETPDWRFTALLGVGLGTAALIHSYAAIFATLIVLLTMLFHAALETPALPRRRLLGVAAGLMIFTVLLVPSSRPAIRLLAPIVATVLALMSSPSWRRRFLVPFAAMVGAAVLTASPLLIRIAGQARDPESFFNLRQQAGGRDLSLPVLSVLWYSIPLLLLVGGAVFWLWRRRRDGDGDAAWSGLIIAALVGGTAMVFNRAWGPDQEPYRFYPYAYFVLAAVAGPWLVTRLRGGRAEMATRLVVVAGILAGLPTIYQFVDQGLPAVQLENAQDLYERAVDVLPEEGLALTDWCVQAQIFKALNGVPVAWFNPGVAYPDHREAIGRAYAAQQSGAFPERADLDTAGITSIVAADGCIESRTKELAFRFGPPLRVEGATENLEIFIVGDEPSPDRDIRLALGDGFWGFEGTPPDVWTWAIRQSELRLWNPTPASCLVTVSATFSTGTADDSTVVIEGPDQRISMEASMSGNDFSMTLTLPPGETRLAVSTDAPRVVAPGDSRELHLRFGNITVERLRCDTMP